jgi:hypothetical protein
MVKYQCDVWSHQLNSRCDTSQSTFWTFIPWKCQQIQFLYLKLRVRILHRVACVFPSWPMDPNTVYLYKKTHETASSKICVGKDVCVWSVVFFCFFTVVSLSLSSYNYYHYISLFINLLSIVKYE